MKSSVIVVRWIAFGALLAVGGVLLSQAPPREQVGPLPDGSFLLNSGWKVKAAGTATPLDTFPMSCVLSPSGRFLVVLNGGYNPPSLSVLDATSGHEIGRTPIEDAWLGLTFSPDGKLLWVGGGSTAKVFEFSFSDAGALLPTRSFDTAAQGGKTWQDFIGDVAATPDGHLLYAADLYHNRVLEINTESGRVVAQFKTGRRPYRILFHPDGKSYFVTHWADGTMGEYDTETGYQMQLIRIGAHPTDIVWGNAAAESDSDDNSPPSARMFVAAANTNNVYSVGISEGKEMRALETINVGTSPVHPLGMTPSALALNPDKTRLYVVCSDANAVAVADISEAQTRVLGFVPTGWYPTAAKVLSDGHLVVLNGRGARSFPNPGGPNPSLRPASVHTGGKQVEFVGVIQTGSASFIPAFTTEQLDAYTREVLANSPYNDEVGASTARAGIPEPIQHVLYIVKENRTYDQVLGDVGKGESDPSLVLFNEKAGPNHHKLAREFVLLDNFYVNGDVSADGQNWSTSAIANDYVQKMWPNSYAKRRDHYDYEGQDIASTPPAGYLWTNAAARGISMRNYGFFANNVKQAGEDGVQVASVRDPVLARVTNMSYRGFDLTYPDRKRAEVFLRDLAQFETSGQMPQLLLMRLGNDHTSGTTPGKIAPLSSFADNDAALGMIVEGVSRSKFWPNTVIMVLEDDAQNGPDHIDSHRSPVFVLSPYTHRAGVNSTMYNTTSVVRTIELILGMRPMTHFDAGARPMTNIFTAEPVLTPYEAEKPRIDLEERNAGNATGAAESARMDFSDADRIDDDELNAVLWRVIRKSDPPAPARSYYSH